MEGYEQYGDGRMPNSCTLPEYRKHYAPDYLIRNIRYLGIAGYILCAVNLAVGLLVNAMALVDVIVLLPLTIGIHMSKSKGCAVGILVYSCIACLLSFLTGGSLTGWGWIALSIYALTTFNRMDKEYRDEMNRRNGRRSY